RPGDPEYLTRGGRPGRTRRHPGSERARGVESSGPTEDSGQDVAQVEPDHVGVGVARLARRDEPGLAFYMGDLGDELEGPVARVLPERVRVAHRELGYRLVVAVGRAGVPVADVRTVGQLVIAVAEVCGAPVDGSRVLRHERVFKSEDGRIRLDEPDPVGARRVCRRDDKVGAGSEEVAAPAVAVEPGADQRQALHDLEVHGSPYALALGGRIRVDGRAVRVDLEGAQEAGHLEVPGQAVDSLRVEGGLRDYVREYVWLRRGRARVDLGRSERGRQDDRPAHVLV